jgi:hypothetical protein
MSAEDFNFCAESYETRALASSGAKWWWSLSWLRERYSNRRMCPRCRTVLRRARKAMFKLERFSFEIVNTASELLEDTLGKDWILCLLFLSTLSEENREFMRRYKDQSNGSVWPAESEQGRGSFHDTFLIEYTVWTDAEDIFLSFVYGPRGHNEIESNLALVNPKGYTIFISALPQIANEQ